MAKDGSDPAAIRDESPVIFIYHKSLQGMGWLGTEAGAELVEQGIADIEAVENALGAEIAVGHNGGRSKLIDDLGPAAPDCVHRLEQFREQTANRN